MTEQTITHPELVQALAKPGSAILASLTPTDADLWHAATGVAGEACEIALAFRNCYEDGKLDNENLIEELGDMEFYLQQLRSNLGISREETLGKHFEGIAPSSEPLYMGIGIAIAGGDILDFIKKIVVYQKMFDRPALVKLLADFETRLLFIRAWACVDHETVLAANIAKLSVRYAGITYSDDAAQARADKA